MLNFSLLLKTTDYQHQLLECKRGGKKSEVLILSRWYLVFLIFLLVLSLSPIDVAFKNHKALGNKGLNNRVLLFNIVRHIKGCLIFSAQLYPNKNEDQKGPSDKLANLGFLHSYVQSRSSWACPRDLISTELTTVPPSVSGITRNFSHLLISLFIRFSSNWLASWSTVRKGTRTEPNRECLPKFHSLRNQTELGFGNCEANRLHRVSNRAVLESRTAICFSVPLLQHLSHQVNRTATEISSKGEKSSLFTCCNKNEELQPRAQQ